MSFWDLVSEVKAEGKTSAEINVGFGVVPDGSKVLAQAKSLKWAKFYESDSELLEVVWEVLEPEQLRGIKTQVKHKIKDLDPNVLKKGEKEADTARNNAFRLFAAMDANSGGRIVNYMNEKKDWPSEDKIAVALIDKPMIVGFKEWLQENGNRGNYIYHVAPKGSEALVVGDSSKVKAMKGSGTPAAVATSGGGWGSPAQQATASRPNIDLDDDIPF